MVYVILIFMLFVPQLSEKTNTMYFMIGKDSENIEYKEYTDKLSGRFMAFYEFTNGLDTEDPIHVYFFMLSRDRNASFDTIIKPRNFLDSIEYHNEKWLLNTRNIEMKLGYGQETKYYIIDTTAIQHDTLKFYRCDISVEGRY